MTGVCQSFAAGVLFCRVQALGVLGGEGCLIVTRWSQRLVFKSTKRNSYRWRRRKGRRRGAKKIS